MHMTKHSSIRGQQRCIPELLIDLLRKFGTTEKAPGGVSTRFFDKAARRRLEKYAGPLATKLEEHLDIYLVVGADDQIITVAHRLERIRRH